jgi:TonB family protein
MATPIIQPVNALDRATKSPAASIVQPENQSASDVHLAPAEVAIGVLEIPVGVWGSRRSMSISAESERIEVFAEETCTVIVFPHGAVIRLSAAIDPGQMMMVANRKSRQAVLCRVTNIRTFPNVKGYAEIEFMGSANNFWGSYAPQGILKQTARFRPAALDQPPQDPETLAPEPTQAWISSPCSTSSKSTELAPGLAEGFWSTSFPKNVNPIPATLAIASPDLPPSDRNKVLSIDRSTKRPSTMKPVEIPAAVSMTSPREGSQADVAKPNPPQSQAVANSSDPSMTSSQVLHADISVTNGSARSLRRRLFSSSFGEPILRTAMDSVPSARRKIIFVWVTVTTIFTIVATGSFLRHHSSVQSATVNQSNLSPMAASGSSIANTVQDLPAENNQISVVPKPPIAKEEKSGPRVRKLVNHPRVSYPSTRKSISGAKILKGKLVSPHFSANRSSIDREVPPDLIGVDSVTGAGAIQGILAAVRPAGGRVKEPHLVSSFPPSYPVAARQAGVEGPVTIDAVIDASGKLTSMKVVSGASLLQRAALDSLRTWRYEPGYLNDKPVSVKTSITVYFHLR